MFTALDNYAPGKQKEVNAHEVDKVTHSYISAEFGRFRCPECGERVSFYPSTVMFTGNKKRAFFKHQRENEFTKECELRDSGSGNVSTYERLGQDIFLKKCGYREFQVLMAFEPLGESAISKYQMLGAKLMIIPENGSAVSQQVLNVNNISFYSKKTTLIELEHVANSYAIRMLYAELGDKWADHADGFTSAGAVFSFSETGGRKLRKGTTISMGEDYYLMVEQTRSRSVPSALCFRDMGILRGDRRTYTVGKIHISNLDVKSNDYYTIKHYFERYYDLTLLIKESEFIPLWPPAVEVDNHYSFIWSKKSVLGYISSGNENPNVFCYSRTSINRIPCENDIVEIDLSQEDVDISVDKKFTGKLYHLHQNKTDDTGVNVKLDILDIEGNKWECRNYEEVPPRGIINIRADVSVIIIHVHQGYSERYTLNQGKEYKIENIKNGDSLFFASDYFIGTMTFLEHRKTSSDETINKYVDHHYKGQFISTPKWISGILKFDISNALQSNIIKYLREGKIPVNEARYLFRLFYEGK